MKFKTSDNLIDLLVGQSLYSNPDVAMRELLQNAEDACYLQSLVDPSYKAEIVVRYSSTSNWVEVADNGLGMEMEVFEESFATIGASKTNSPKLQAILNKAGAGDRPIGQFGIGVLSCFGVADIIEVRTCAEKKQAVSVRIHDRREPFEDLNDHRDTRGTTLRLSLKQGGPMHAHQVPKSVENYVRHAHHIWIENIDTGDRIIAPERWLLKSWEPSSKLDSTIIESGHLQLSDAWDNINMGLNARLVSCNGGFLVSLVTVDVLPQFALGFDGEINIRPGALTILLNREGFQQDERLVTLAKELTSHYQKLVEEKLEGWLATDFMEISIDSRRAMQRMVLLILQTQMKEVIGPENVERASRLVPQILLLADLDRTPFQKLIETAKIKPPLYVHKTDIQNNIQRSFSTGGGNYQITEAVRTVDLRMTLLKLNGFAVAKTEPHTYSVNFGNRNQNIQVHDYDVLSNYLAAIQVPISQVQEAPAEYTKIGSSLDADAITGLFQLSSDLKIHSVDGMTEAIIADFNGYILNSENPEIKSILRVLPQAVGNPIRKELLAAYFALSTYNVSNAREIILALITDAEFEEKARRITGRFFRQFLEERVEALLTSKAPPND